MRAAPEMPQAMVRDGESSLAVSSDRAGGSWVDHQETCQVCGGRVLRDTRSGNIWIQIRGVWDLDTNNVLGEVG